MGDTKIIQKANILQQALKQAADGNQNLFVEVEMTAQKNIFQGDRTFNLQFWLEHLPEPRLKNAIIDLKQAALARFNGDWEKVDRWLGVNDGFFSLFDFLSNLPVPKLKNLINEAIIQTMEHFKNTGLAAQWLGGSRHLITWRFKTKRNLIETEIVRPQKRGLLTE
jgi:hypothetical protein